MVGLGSGVKLFVPLLVIFLVLADIGLYYVFSRLEDTVVDGFDRSLLAASRLVASRLDLSAVEDFSGKRTGPEYARALRKTLMTACVEARLLGAMIVSRDMEVLLDSRAIDRSGATLTAAAGFSGLEDVWDGEEVFITVRSEDGFWTRYAFVPLAVSDRVSVALAVGSDFSLHHRLLKATQAYMLVRLVFLIALVGAVLLFVVSVLKPFERLKRTALVVRGESEDEEDSEFIISTFQKVVVDLREKESELQGLLAEQRIKAEDLEEYNEYILSNMPGGLVSTDREGLITNFNRAASEMLGISAQAAVGSAFGEVLNVPLLAGMMKDALGTGETSTGVEIAVPGEKGDAHLSVSSSLLRRDDGDVIGAALVFTDITELKRLQENVLVRQKLASLGEMSAGIAHQFRNSLGSIIGYASLLKKKGSGISTIDKILKESKIFSYLVESFLNFARPVRIQPSAVDLGSLVIDTLEPLRQEMAEGGVELDSVFRQDDVNVAGDPVLLKQALSNLFRNSLDAMRTGGSLRIELDTDGETATLKITDTGRGIPSDQLSHIFTPFFSLTEGGVGLGLPIAHRIITSHGGAIDVKSRPGLGTTVTVSLPSKAELDE